MKVTLTVETGQKVPREPRVSNPRPAGPPRASHGRPGRRGKRIPLTRAEVFARRAKLDLVLASDEGTRALILLSPETRRNALRGASRRQVLKALAFARRWLEGLEQEHAKLVARRFKAEFLGESRDELLDVAADSLPRAAKETRAAYESRVGAFVAGLRPRLALHAATRAP